MTHSLRPTAWRIVRAARHQRNNPTRRNAQAAIHREYRGRMASKQAHRRQGGQRFLAVLRAPTAVETAIAAQVNWPAALKQ